MLAIPVRFPVAEIRPCTPLCTGQLDSWKGDRDVSVGEHRFVLPRVLKLSVFYDLVTQLVRINEGRLLRVHCRQM